MRARAAVVAIVGGGEAAAPPGHGGNMAPCPLMQFAEYVQLRHLGLSLDWDPGLEAACGGAAFPPQNGNGGAVAAPLALAPLHTEGLLPAGAVAAEGQQGEGIEVQLPDGTPLAALRVTLEARAASGALRAVRAGEEALQWLEAHVAEFPVIEHGP